MDSTTKKSGLWKKGKTRKTRTPDMLNKWFSNYEKIKQGVYLDTFTQDAEIWIMDYANIIHILYNSIGEFEYIQRLFKTFIVEKTPNIIIVAKPVFINDQDYRVRKILEGIPPMKLPPIIEIKYGKNKKSSLDDLIFLWVAFVKFASGANVVLLTNDHQDFRKNLFGQTSAEVKLKQSLRITQWKKGIATPASSEFMAWLRSLIHHKSNDITGLECNIMQVVSRMRSIITQDEMTKLAFQAVENCENIGIIDPNGQIREEYYLYASFKFMQSSVCYDDFCSLTVNQILHLFAGNLRH